MCTVRMAHAVRTAASAHGVPAAHTPPATPAAAPAPPGSPAWAHRELLAMIEEARGSPDPEAVLSCLERLMSHVATLGEAGRACLLWGKDPSEPPAP